MSTLSNLEAEAKLKSLGLENTWKVENNGLDAHFVFKDFREAMQFMLISGKVADKADHHPEWKNVYNRVTVHLSTHSEKGITEKDISLATAMHYIFTEGSYLAGSIF